MIMASSLSMLPFHKTKFVLLNGNIESNQYFYINNFNMNYINDNKLSIFLLNIRILPDHYFNELLGDILCKLDSEKNMYTLQETSIAIH